LIGFPTLLNWSSASRPWSVRKKDRRKSRRLEIAIANILATKCDHFERTQPDAIKLNLLQRDLPRGLGQKQAAPIQARGAISIVVPATKCVVAIIASRCYGRAAGYSPADPYR